jgi:hypothetical protein
MARFITEILRILRIRRDVPGLCRGGVLADRVSMASESMYGIIADFQQCRHLYQDSSSQ